MARPSKTLEQIDHNIAAITAGMNKLDMSSAKVEESEPQTKISNKEMQKNDAPYIKPLKSMGGSKPDPRFEAEREKGWEYVKVIAEHHEIIGESVKLWIQKYPGDAQTYWEIPVNKPVYIPRHIAEHLATRNFNQITMEERAAYEVSDASPLTHKVVVKTKKERITCRPAGFSF